MFQPNLQSNFNFGSFPPPVISTPPGEIAAAPGDLKTLTQEQYQELYDSLISVVPSTIQHQVAFDTSNNQIITSNEICLHVHDK